MGALAGAADAIGAQLPLILGLMIPFLGIVVPGIVIMALATPSRNRHAVLTSSGGATAVAGAQAVLPHTTGGAAAYDRKGGMPWACERLRESDIFEGLTDHELRMVASIGERRRVAPGERLAHAGSRGDHLFLILDGEFRLLTHGHEEIPVRMAHAGETVPLAVIIDPPVLVTTIEAITAGEVFAIPRMRLLELFDVQPMIGLQVYRAASKSFEHRYRKSLDGLVGALKVALQPPATRAPSPAEEPARQPQE